MIALCLDVATKTGWAILDKGKVTKSGVMSVANSRWDGAGARFNKYDYWLTKTIQDKRIDYVVYEAVEAHMGGVYSAHVYGGYVSIIQKVCEEFMIPYQGVGVSAIKKTFTGKGNAGKEDVIQECFNRGHNPEDDNEADAIAIAYTAKETIFPQNR